MADSQFKTMLDLAILDARAFEALSSDESFAALAGFHAQQAVEKALKAVLSCKGATFPLTHNLTVLLGYLQQIGVDCPVSARQVSLLIPYAVDGRYDELIGDLTIESMRSTTNQVLDWAKQLIDKENA